MLITPLPSAVDVRRADPDSQSFPYDRVTDENELIAVMDLITVMWWWVSLALFLRKMFIR